MASVINGPSVSSLTFDANRSGPLVAGSALTAADIFPSARSPMRRPGMQALSATSSTGAGGWSVSGGTLSNSVITWPDGSTTPAMRVQGANPGQFATVTLRRKLSTPLPLSGKVEVPIFYPTSSGAGFDLKVTTTNDLAANISDPPAGAFTNRLSYTFPFAVMKRGFSQVLDIDLSASAGTVPNPPNGGSAPVSAGTSDPLRINGIELVLNIPAGTTTYIDIGDIPIGGRSTPMLMLCADAGGSIDHHQYLLPEAEKRGFKMGIACRADNMDAFFPILDRIYKAGNDLLNEGWYHRNYMTFAANLMEDAEAARAKMVGYGWTRGAQIFAAPQLALNSGLAGTAGVATLWAAGFKLMRSGNRSSIPVSSIGKEMPYFGAYGSGGTAGTAALVSNYLDSLELHGDSGMVLFHNIITGTPAVGSTDTQLSEYQAMLTDIANRVATGRLVVVSPSEFVRLINS